MGDFHSRFNNVVSEELAPAVEPRYIVRVERRVYVEHGLGDDEQVPCAAKRIESGLDAANYALEHCHRRYNSK